MIDAIYHRMALDVAGRSMELLRKRHAYITANIANADTPGYKAKRFSFEKELQDVVYGTDELPLYVTHPMHIPSAPATLEDVKGRVDRVMFPVRNDENSVDIDKEMALLAENQLKYNAIAQAYSMQIGKLKYAITGR